MSYDGHLPLDRVITTPELERRPSRPPDHALESRALNQLMEAMANLPVADSVMQQLAETALVICRAHSAGVSILERDDGRATFRWQAAAGKWAIHRGEVMPRHSPSGTVLDRNAPLLMTHPERHYTYAPTVTLPIAEALLVPFHDCGEPAGTIWVIAHDDTRKFDAEDRRLLTSLGRFAANAYQLLNQEQLAMELAATQCIQEVSTELLREKTVDALYDKILLAAATMMRSDFASIQKYHPERGAGALQLLAHRGFSQQAASHWQWIRPVSTTCCGMALALGKRVIVPDIEEDKSISDEQLKAYRELGIRSVQSTPLLTRGGDMRGMISTHWRHPHHPAKRDLNLLDILSRQAADLIEREQSADKERILTRELQHRGSNLLAVVQAIAQRTLSSSDSLAHAKAKFEARLHALARVHRRLTTSDWAGVQLAEIVGAELAPFVDRTQIDGLEVALSPQQAQDFSLVVHELATNAVKYGALSNADGTVSVSWRRDNGGLKFQWLERGGPIVVAPLRQGFGTQLLKTVFGETRFDYAPEGFGCEIKLRLSPATTALPLASDLTQTHTLAAD